MMVIMTRVGEWEKRETPSSPEAEPRRLGAFMPSIARTHTAETRRTRKFRGSCSAAA